MHLYVLKGLGGLTSAVSGGQSSSSTSSAVAVSGVGGTTSGGTSSAAGTNSNPSLSSSFNYFTNLALVNLEFLSNSNKPRY